MGCPKCHSDEWKSASLVYSEGLHSTNTSTSAHGVGIGTGGIGVGIGSAKSTGYQQSALSRKAAPPAPPSGMSVNGFSFMLVCGFFGVMAFVSGIQSLDWELLLLGLAFLAVPAMAILIARRKRRERKQYESRFTDWEKSKICMRCGCHY